MILLTYSQYSMQWYIIDWLPLILFRRGDCYYSGYCDPGSDDLIGLFDIDRLSGYAGLAIVTVIDGVTKAVTVVAVIYLLTVIVDDDYLLLLWWWRMTYSDYSHYRDWYVIIDRYSVVLLYYYYCCDWLLARRRRTLIVVLAWLLWWYCYYWPQWWLMTQAYSHSPSDEWLFIFVMQFVTWPHYSLVVCIGLLVTVIDCWYWGPYSDYYYWYSIDY